MVAISGMLDTDFVPVTRASYLKVNIRALGTWFGSKSFNRNSYDLCHGNLMSEMAMKRK
jgi:hypothetical protein